MIAPVGAAPSETMRPVSPRAIHRLAPSHLPSTFAGDVGFGAPLVIHLWDNHALTRISDLTTTENLGDVSNIVC